MLVASQTFRFAWPLYNLYAMLVCSTGDNVRLPDDLIIDKRVGLEETAKPAVYAQKKLEVCTRVLMSPDASQKPL